MGLLRRLDVLFFLLPLLDAVFFAAVLLPAAVLVAAGFFVVVFPLLCGK
jgi:hypothetical protein